jgi:hypothetical protein
MFREVIAVEWDNYIKHVNTFFLSSLSFLFLPSSTYLFTEGVEGF